MQQTSKFTFNMRSTWFDHSVQSRGAKTCGTVDQSELAQYSSQRYEMREIRQKVQFNSALIARET